MSQEGELDWTQSGSPHICFRLLIAVVLSFISSSIGKGFAAECLFGITGVPKVSPAQFLASHVKSTHWTTGFTTLNYHTAHCIIQSLLTNHAELSFYITGKVNKILPITKLKSHDFSENLACNVLSMQLNCCDFIYAHCKENLNLCSTT